MLSGLFESLDSIKTPMYFIENVEYNNQVFFRRNSIQRNNLSMEFVEIFPP